MDVEIQCPVAWDLGPVTHDKLGWAASAEKLLIEMFLSKQKTTCCFHLAVREVVTTFPCRSHEVRLRLAVPKHSVKVASAPLASKEPREY
jgi:hypothetical protein